MQSASDPQGADVSLLKAWGVEAIVDLMVENKKKKSARPARKERVTAGGGNGRPARIWGWQD